MAQQTREQYHATRRAAAQAFKGAHGAWPEEGAKFCPECSGEGVCETVDRGASNATEPTYREIPCDGCKGHGVVDDSCHIDPLYRLLSSRRTLAWLKGLGGDVEFRRASHLRLVKALGKPVRLPADRRPVPQLRAALLAPRFDLTNYANALFRAVAA